MPIIVPAEYQIRHPARPGHTDTLYDAPMNVSGSAHNCSVTVFLFKIVRQMTASSLLHVWDVLTTAP